MFNCILAHFFVCSIGILKSNVKISHYGCGFVSFYHNSVKFYYVILFSILGQFFSHNSVVFKVLLLVTIRFSINRFLLSFSSLHKHSPLNLKSFFFKKKKNLSLFININISPFFWLVLTTCLLSSFLHNYVFSYYVSYKHPINEFLKSYLRISQNKWV